MLIIEVCFVLMVLIVVDCMNIGMIVEISVMLVVRV